MGNCPCTQIVLAPYSYEDLNELYEGS
jgi:hypothetical protein